MKRTTRTHPDVWRRPRRGAVALAALAAALAIPPSFASGKGTNDGADPDRACSATASTLFTACGNGVQADDGTARAVCRNLSREPAQARCLADARAARREGDRLCRQQLAARRKACALFGEDPYDPPFDAASFDEDFTHPTKPNRYFPLRIGNRWEYRGGAETTIVEVLNATKRIAGVTCVVVRDRVLVSGQVVEDTRDWFAQAKDGTVWYCGEEVKSFETFSGDEPPEPELVALDGSFKAGRDGAKPGIIFLAAPARDRAYREEFALTSAEDVAEVLSTSYAFGDDPDLDRLVPGPLATALCAADCVVTLNYSLLEPGVFERKYYAPGIGIFLETAPDSGEVVPLVDCNFDPRCATLPQP